MDEACLWWKIAPAIQIPKYPQFWQVFFSPKMSMTTLMFFFQNPDPSQITGLYRNISMGRTTLQLQRRSPSASRLWGCAEQQAKHHKNGGKHESSSRKLITQFWRSKYRRIWTWNKLRCFTKKTQTNPDGVSFQTRICNYHQVSTIFPHDRLGCICM